MRSPLQPGADIADDDRAPHAFEVVDTAEEAASLELAPLLVREPLRRFLDECGLGDGELEARRVGDGHSNVTYLIRRGDERFVVRRPPRPPLPPSAHDVLREARILRALAGREVAVPAVLATCDDESVIGAPFYVMEYLDGIVLTAATPPAFATPEHRHRLGELVVSELVALHSIDVETGPLSELGRPTGYLERQVRRFAQLWERGRTRELAVLDRVTAWLGEHLPHSGRPAVVHGDYRIGNMIFAAQPPARVLGILDWEMATLGDPLADLGYLTAHMAQAQRPANVIRDLQPVTREPGFPDAAWMTDRYAELTGADVSELRWYRVLAIWKSAVFLEQSYQRFLSGNELDPWFAELGAGVPDLAEQAWEEAQSRS
ncbi:MAG: phosphotransferase family protein [Solirubrobacterales bacterium]|nr:phosphotransferase family protein [Solirubrobacterales bacterium]